MVISCVARVPNPKPNVLSIPKQVWRWIQAIQQHTGRLPHFFCYPSGKWDADVIAVLKSPGYWGVVTAEMPS